MVMCWAYGCNHYNNRETCRFFSLPKDQKLRKKWLSLLRRVDTPGKNTSVCSCHFRDGKKENLPEIFVFNKGKKFGPDYLNPEKRKRSKRKLPSNSTQSQSSGKRSKSNGNFPSTSTGSNNHISETSPDPEDPDVFPNNSQTSLKYTLKRQSNVDNESNSTTISTESFSCISCVVSECTSTSNEEGVEFFPFPESDITKYKWLQFCGKGTIDVDNNSAYVCSKHFEENSYITEIKDFGNVTCLIRRLDPEAVPIMNPPTMFKEEDISSEEYIVEYVNVDEPIPKLDCEVYGHIKTKEDLFKLKICNSKLEKKNKLLKSNLQTLRKTLKKKEELLLSLEKQVSTKILYEDVLGKIFSKSQIKLLCGSKKTQWTDDDFAVGFTISYLSNRTFYNYLTNTLNFPFPGLSSIQRYLTINKRNGGSSNGGSFLKEEEITSD